MKEIVPSPPPPPLVHNQFESVRELFSRNVVPSLCLASDAMLVQIERQT